MCYNFASMFEGRVERAERDAHRSEKVSRRLPLSLSLFLDPQQQHVFSSQIIAATMHISTPFSAISAFTRSGKIVQRFSFFLSI